MFADNRSVDWFVLGMTFGYLLYPFWMIIKAICVNAWRNTDSACTGDCNQGRSCNCTKDPK